MINLKRLAKLLVPPIMLPVVRRVWNHRHRILFKGDFSSWEAALEVSNGYDAPDILYKVRQAALRVKRGEAVFERDGVCFYHEEYRWPTLACLLRVAAENNGRLHVIDFGGSLGSFWFQHRRHLSMLEDIRWVVVEQPHYVACGRKEFQDGILLFAESLQEALEECSADIIFCSSVIQYLPEPYGRLQRFANSGVRWLLLDRTPFIESDRDRLTIQYVPSSIYKASYPAWFFSRRRFNDLLRRIGYSEHVRFHAEDDIGIGSFEGVLLERI